MGRGERMQHELLSGDMMLEDLLLPLALPWHLPGELREEDWFSYGHLSFERENQAGKWGVKGEWGWQRELLEPGAHGTNPSSSCGHPSSAQPCQPWIPFCPCSAISAQHWLTALGPALLSQQLLLWRDKMKKEAWVCWSVRGCHNNHWVFFFQLRDNDKTWLPGEGFFWE